MPKPQLKPSPIEVLAQDFVEINIKATPEVDEYGAGKLEVERELAQQNPENSREWTIFLSVSISQPKDQAPPSYVGRIVARGIYEVHPDYPKDPERLVRVTAASMLYGATREMLNTLTARGPNGMVTLPSVSFYEEALKEKKPPAKTAANKTAD